MSHCLPSPPPKPAAPTVQIAASSKQTQLITGPSLAVVTSCFSRTAVGEEISPRVRGVASLQMRLQLETRPREYNRKQRDSPPKLGGEVLSARLEFPFCFQRDPQCAMERQRHERGDASQNRIPVENARFACGLKICPQRFEKTSLVVKRHTAHNVS